MKKLLTILIFAVLCGGSVVAYDFSAVCESGQTLYYIITSSTEPYTVEVTNEETGWPYNNYTYVTGSLVIPQSVTFNGITYLVTSIGNYAFLDCHELTSVTIPNSVILIGKRTFDYCRQLSSVNIGNSVETIKYRAFGDCISLTTIDIPNSVKTIEYAAFEGCTGLVTITIPSSVEDMDFRPFEGCTSLTAINVDSGNTHYKSIDGVLFDYEVNVLIQYPGGKQGDYSIPNSVTRIRANAFFYCIGITSVTIGNSLRTFEDDYPIFNTFYECTNLTAINVVQENVYYKSIDGVLFNHSTDTIIEYPSGRSGSYTIPESVTTIKEGAFCCCRGLTSVTIPNSVTSIGEGAFASTGWYNNQPDGILYLDGWCLGYKGDRPTGTLAIAEGTKKISSKAFYSCTGLTSVTIPNSVTSICEQAFANDNGLASVYYTGNIGQWCNISFYDGGANPISEAHNLYIDNTLVTNLTIPNSITEIKDYAFSYAYCLETLNIGNGVTSIGKYAFNYCRNLETSITIPSSLTSIGAKAFNYCGFDTVYSLAVNPPSIPSSTLYDDRVFDLGTIVFVPCGRVSAYNNSNWSYLTIYENPDCTGVSVDSEKISTKAELFPNPATDVLNITSSETISEIEIVNTLGQVVKRIEVNSDNAVCDVEELPNGFYVVRIYNEDTKSFCQKKFAKE